MSLFPHLAAQKDRMPTETRTSTGDVDGATDSAITATVMRVVLDEASYKVFKRRLCASWQPRATVPTAAVDAGGAEAGSCGGTAEVGDDAAAKSALGRTRGGTVRDAAAGATALSRRGLHEAMARVRLLVRTVLATHTRVGDAYALALTHYDLTTTKRDAIKLPAVKARHDRYVVLAQEQLSAADAVLQASTPAYDVAVLADTSVAAIAGMPFGAASLSVEARVRELEALVVKLEDAIPVVRVC